MARVLYLGQKWLGERCFEVLRQAEGTALRIGGVVSNVRTDVWWGSARIYDEARAVGVPLLSNEKRNDDAIEAMIMEQEIDTIVSCQHPWILPPRILARVRSAAFNVHNAKLPTYGGHNACNHAILDRCSSFTSTVHWMVDDVDSGDIAFEETFSIDPRETARSLYEKALVSGERVFRRLVEHLVEAKAIPRMPLAGPPIIYPRGSIDSLREIRDVTDAAEVDLKARAFYFPPFEPAYWRRGDRKFYVLPGDGHRESWRLSG